MKKKIGLYLILLLVGFLSLPVTSCLTPNTGTPTVGTISPPVLNATGALNLSIFQVKGKVSRPPGQSVEGVVVTITNVTTPAQTQKVVNADGSFSQGIAGNPGDLVRVVAVDPKTQQQSNIVEAIIPYSGEVEFQATVDLDQDGIPDAKVPSPEERNAVLQIIQGFLLTPQ